LTFPDALWLTRQVRDPICKCAFADPAGPEDLLSDSGLKDLLQKIIERRPPDEHAMGSAWQDCVGMFYVCLLKLVLELCYVLSDDFIVSACSDVEEDQSLIDLFSVR
jgi:hypothetical protein